MGTPLVADLFLFCYERDFMMSLSDDKQADTIDAFNTTQVNRMSRSRKVLAIGGKH